MYFRFFRFFVLNIILVGICFSLSGCFIGRVYEGAAIETDKLNEIQLKKTTKDEIISWFGPPKTFTRPVLLEEVTKNLRLAKAQEAGTIFHEVFTYEYKRANAFLLFLILYNYVDLDIKSDYLVLFFNELGTVENWAFANDIELLRSLGFFSGTPEKRVVHKEGKE